MARGGHRVLSAMTKAKISASLRGNKNAYRGGPKKRLTSREKVANINARTSANKLKLNDAQLRQRSAVAKRLRARARAEEAGIKPDHSKSIPTPNTISQRDSRTRGSDARAKGSIAKVETKSAGKNSRKPTIEEGKAQYARNQTLGPRLQNHAANRGMTESQYARFANKATGLDSALARRTAMAQNGKGNFSTTQTKSIGKNGAQLTPQERVAALRKEGKSMNEALAIVDGRTPETASSRRAARGEAMLRDVNKKARRSAGMASGKTADRTPSSKDRDPRVEKPAPFPKADSSSTGEKPGAALKKFMGQQPMAVKQEALAMLRAFGQQHNLGADGEG